MRTKLDPNALVNIPCPKCGEKTPQTVGMLETSPRIRCESCGSLFGVNFTKIAKKIEEAQAEAEAARRGF